MKAWSARTNDGTVLFVSTKNGPSLCGLADVLLCVEFVAMSCSGRTSRDVCVVGGMLSLTPVSSFHERKTLKTQSYVGLHVEAVL